MNTTRIMIGGLLLLFTLLSGIWLSHLGKPYNGALFTVHKLIALGAVVWLGAMIYGSHHNAPVGAPGAIIIVVTGLLVLALFISGASLSIGKPDSLALLTMHRVIPWLATVAVAATVYALTVSATR